MFWDLGFWVSYFGSFVHFGVFWGFGALGAWGLGVLRDLCLGLGRFRA